MVRGIILALSLMLVGCSSGENAKDRIIPASDETMKQIYDNGGRSDNGNNSTLVNQSKLKDVLNRGALGDEQDLNVYRLNGVSPQSNFIKLYNPTLHLYFPPKISERDGMPIPAWMTEFKMYDRDEYSLYERVKVGNRQ